MTGIPYSDSSGLVLELEKSWQSRAYEYCILDMTRGGCAIGYGHHKPYPVQSEYVARMVDSKKESVPCLLRWSLAWTNAGEEIYRIADWRRKTKGPIHFLHLSIREMELDVNHLRQALRLGDGDVDELVIPNGLWRSESAAHQLCLVGRLLSGRVVNFERMCASIRSTILPIKCMDIKQLLADRILIKFNHVIDRSRALEGCPWSFEKNVLVLSSVAENKNPMQVDLNWCDVHIQVHDLPLSKMNRKIATFIGNKIEKFKDMDMDTKETSWGATLRIIVAIDIMLPLPRYEESFQDLRNDTPYRPWLKAPIPNKLQPRLTSRINNHRQFATERDEEVGMMALDVNEEGQHDAARMELQTDPSLTTGIAATVAGQIDKLATMENPKIFSKTELFNIAHIFAANGGGRRCSNRRGRRAQFRQKLPFESENEE
ncbi:hypothetical protein Sango_2315600 [Sesamum angolense]|uniref:DUF4283 domain-containing protein n=1 Tax=Sesamum angolense TaxID=2727404 RepID=A0AAE1WAL2_9LAMI|nr:hypothetical protein Sango_2315600 [Sesamum angolense]